MVETNWREILSFSQRELKQADKEQLCESLSWMEADDIELNFTDLKTLFRLAQDILKYKSEQVNNLMGELEKGSRKGKKKKHREINGESSTKTSDSILDTINHQEEVIKANKEIIQQLNSEIAKLEERKNKVEMTVHNDDESESSHDPLSEINAKVQLENEILKKNRHIRKLLVDVKVLEEENVNLKQKLIHLKDKFKEATQLIENLTGQLFSINDECSKLKEALGKSEETKNHLLLKIESLGKEMNTKDIGKESMEENNIKSKIQLLKNSLKSHKREIERLSCENTQLKENLILASKAATSPNKPETYSEQAAITELQDKLIEASTKIEESANLIQSLKTDNKRLQSIIDNAGDMSMHENKNESDDGKEKNMISKLKSQLKSITATLKATEEIVTTREKELSDLTSQLQLLQSEDGINTLFKSLKNNKRQLQIKNEGIKNLVIEINSLHQRIDKIQLENETLRQKLNIPLEQKVETHGILKRYQDLERNILRITKELHENEKKLVSVEMENRMKNTKIVKLQKLLYNFGYDSDKIIESLNEIAEDTDSEQNDVTTVTLINKDSRKIKDSEIQAIIKENEGLRIGLQEILNFLKDNSTTSSGVLSLKCPTLETLCHSMDARHAAGWFAPHMKTVMELKEALGGRDALLIALHESRKQTFEIMAELSKEALKSSELEKRLVEIESHKNKEKLHLANDMDVTDSKLWLVESEPRDIDYKSDDQIQDMILRRNIQYENQLKTSLNYFQEKFKSLYDKLTALAISATDNNNKWSIQEENYRAEIENLQAKLIQNADDETSIQSPGLVSNPDIVELQRKVTYLEDSYKYIRTQNENLKNEYSESYRDSLIMASDYETKVQKLILCNINLRDKLRRSVPENLFWQQNTALNELNIKYRNSVETYICNHIERYNLQKRLDEDKSYILSCFHKELKVDKAHGDNGDEKKLEERLEASIYKQQLEQVITELDDKNSQIESLRKKNIELEIASGKITETLMGSKFENGERFLEQENDNLRKENGIIKQEIQSLRTQLDISLIKLNEIQQQKLVTDIEINLLRHQILDLQSVSDNKAIIARLSGEILMAHLQASENFKKIEKLTLLLNKEKDLRADTENMLKARQNLLDYHISCNEHKFRIMYETIQVFKQQYQGSLPLCTIENYLTNLEEQDKKTYAANEKLNEIEDLRQNLMIKHSVYNQILETTKGQCSEDGNMCEHFLKNIVTNKLQTQELDLCKKKIHTLEKSRKTILDRCNLLERTFILISQEHKANNEMESKSSNNNEINIELEDITDNETSSNETRNKTFTIAKSNICKQTQEKLKDDVIVSPKKSFHSNNISMDQIPLQKIKLVNVNTQTSVIKEKLIDTKVTQTEEDQKIVELERKISNLNVDLKQEIKKSNKIKSEMQGLTQEMSIVKEQKYLLESTIHNLTDSHKQKDDLINSLQNNIFGLRNQIDDFKSNQYAQILQEKNTSVEENKHLLQTLKELEGDKHAIITEYRELLSREREEYSKTVKELKEKLLVQSQLERKATKADTPNDHVKETVGKYILKITELEDKCFKLQSNLDGCKSEIMTCQGELDRWKDLANERLSKMEQLSTQLKERHNDEVESYKAENQHWLSQLNETQREHMDLRSRLTEQKALYIKQLADKDAHIEQLRTVVHNLKTQIMNMQTMLSINDPSFDLSAIVEVEEASDAVSPQGSERLELKFESVVDLQDFQDDGPYVKIPTTSTAIWHEPLLERLRREKQLISKQNAILRRQIKAVAARERRARLDAQNLKNQVFRITTSGNKVTSVESAALQNKIASLQAQLTSARRDAHSSVAIWDKWKRAQQAADRWQARYEEKCQEEKKLETSLSLSKSALSRLEKEKRVLLSRLSELKSEKSSVTEKQDDERSEKGTRSQNDYLCSSPPVSTRALLDRIQAQQRRIAALEVAEKGNEPLVSEYERALAEITSLKGQVLKLESTLLESQIRAPLTSSNDPQPELEYWKSYCDMLKEENMQLTLRVNSLETVPASAHQHRINDLEQTVLTLRGLVSKLQADQKSGVVRRVESRPGSGRSTNEKVRHQIDSYRTEISNLKRTIQEKDLLLERSKEMLKIAAEREEELLKEISWAGNSARLRKCIQCYADDELRRVYKVHKKNESYANASLRRQFNELVEHRGEFYSA